MKSNLFVSWVGSTRSYAFSSGDWSPLSGTRNPISLPNFPTRILYRVTIDTEKLASSLLVNSVLNKSPVAINERGGTLMGNRNEQPVACEARARECSSFDLLNSVNIDAALVRNDPRNPEFTPCPLITFRVSKHAGHHPSSFASVPKLRQRTENEKRVARGASRHGRVEELRTRSDSRGTHGLRRSGALVGYQRGDSRRIHSWGSNGGVTNVLVGAVARAQAAGMRLLSFFSFFAGIATDTSPRARCHYVGWHVIR